MVMGRTWQRNGWQGWRVALAGAMMLLAVAVCWTAWSDIAHICWADAESGHIMLVPFVAAWLVWVRRGRLRQCRPGRGYIGVLILAAGVFLSYYGYQHAVQTFWHAGAVLTLVGAGLAVVGGDIFRQFLPAICVLVFLVPVPGTIRQQIAIPLQTATAYMTQQVFDLVGIAVGRSGNLLTINDVPVNIIEACNGLRMVFALVLVSYAFAFGTPLRGYVRFLILVFSPISAIVCNVVRLVPTVWIYGQFQRTHPQVADSIHEVGGWIMLVVAFLMLMGIIRVLRWALLPVQQFTLAYD